jgi:hypothetical protein
MLHILHLHCFYNIKHIKNNINMKDVKICNAIQVEHYISTLT